MINFRPLLTTIYLVTLLLLLNGCSVGLQVDLEAPDAVHPISQTSSFHTETKPQLVEPGQYEVKKKFTHTFQKWGLGSPFNSKKHKDLSRFFNRIIEKHDGDAIVDLEVSVANAPSNNLFLVTKIVGFTLGVFGIIQATQDPTVPNATFAAGSSLVYLFSPSSVHIRLEGKVVALRSSEEEL